MGTTSASAVPVIDLGPWFAGSEAGREQVARAVDVALREIGFLLITNHGVDRALCEAVRETSRRFFELPAAVKERYRSQVGGESWLPRGWTPLGAEANANSDEGVTAPPDLKESYNIACFAATGDEAIDREWFTENIWPDEVPDYRVAVTTYVEKMRALVDELLEIAAVALGLGERRFLDFAGHPTWSFYTHWYPALHDVGAPVPGQLRIGSHTDFGTFTILDRQLGTGGLQVLGKDGEWADAPWVDGALTVNIGDLMARWTGDRWLSNRHRVLAPDASAPDEDLMSLVYFHEADPAAIIRSVPPPIGVVEHEPVAAGDYLRAKLAAIAVP
ncbi:MAG TPA: 2-oxoglutarate and iron-dependent oxygenase domain-containing protein [Mycobacteriales bacterium]|jgi:isopenicillin N synthase-like dioxygenase|nr:2-oxoglutarate and iron-dependent oxygenase domain-containing protein [Mycobacteriales bacterium]